jgi:carbon storage regulator CsrA
VIVTVVDIERGKIRLGISAPKSVVIAREELVSPADPRRKLGHPAAGTEGDS